VFAFAVEFAFAVAFELSEVEHAAAPSAKAAIATILKSFVLTSIPPESFNVNRQIVGNQRASN
jgi:hypothetical protein